MAATRAMVRSRDCRRSSAFSALAMASGDFPAWRDEATSLRFGSSLLRAAAVLARALSGEAQPIPLDGLKEEYEAS